MGKKVDIKCPHVYDIVKENPCFSSFLWPGYPIPKLDMNFSLEPREEAWVKELQDSKEMKQLLDSKLGK